MEYLGHIVLEYGVQMDKTKIEVIIKWQEPINIKQLRGFLGLSGYYIIFRHHYASIVASLTELLRKDSFQWFANAQSTFLKLKQAIAYAPVL